MRAIVARTSRSRHPRVHPVEIIFRHDDDAAHPHPIFAKSHSLLMGNCASTRGSRTHTHTHIVKNCVCMCVCGCFVRTGPAGRRSRNLGLCVWQNYLRPVSIKYMDICLSVGPAASWLVFWLACRFDGGGGGFVRASASQFRIALIVACDMWKCHNALVNAVFCVCFVLFIGHTKSSCNISDRHT